VPLPRQWTWVSLIVLFLWPAAAHAWWNEEWAARKPVQIEANASGASAQPAGPAPVLVRLHVGNFRFELAKEDGSDLRFVAADDKTPLPFHLEKYDHLLGEALVWVALPEQKPGAKTQVWLYFHNPKASAAEDAKGTYDKAAVLVWHFAERGQAPRDSASFANHAAADKPVEGSDGALIGRGLKLDGASSITLPASPTLAWPAGAKISWSAWIKPALAEQNGVIFARRDGRTALRVALRGGKPVVELESPAGVQRATGAIALPAASWHHLGFSAGESIVLFIDGVEAGRFPGPLPELASAPVLGRDPLADAPADALPPFKGELDELQLSNLERPAGWFQFAAATQGGDSARSISYGQDEESGGGTGYFTVIIRSVTPDGWVVIGLLGVMAAVAVWVMVTKARLLGRVQSANARFTARFDKEGLALFGGVRNGAKASSNEKVDERVLRDSTLYKLGRVCTDQAHQRTSKGRDLSAQALESIRASLDAELVRQGQMLNNQLVLLTIAISGGPFLGLLGTVVGVMITFAAIAAAGDVNVNAIAPGIAAALVATVAGLAVAIPSLFGYNWLLTQVKGVVASQQVFADELLTRLAEEHAESARQVEVVHEEGTVVRPFHAPPPPPPSDA
jgi:biopolymer transport protein ExbB